MITLDKLCIPASVILIYNAQALVIYEECMWSRVGEKADKWGQKNVIKCVQKKLKLNYVNFIDVQKM